MDNPHDFSSLKEKINNAKTPKTNKKTKKLFYPIVFLVLGIFLVFAGGAYALQQILDKIVPCSQTDSGICFDIVKQGSSLNKYMIKNLDEDKDYRLHIKRKVGDSTVDVGSVDLDMEDIREKQSGDSCFDYNQSSDTPNIRCCGDFVLKSDYYNADAWSQFVCCKPGECAEDGRCIADGIARYSDEPGTAPRICEKGVWKDSSDSPSLKCKDNEDGKDYALKGGIEQGDFAISDQCSDGKTLVEVYCENDELKREIVLCADTCDDPLEDCGNVCIDGACVQSSADCVGVNVEMNHENFVCCGDLAKKTDLWNDGNYENYGCCKPSDCLQDITCVPNGFDKTEDWGVKCVDGEWEGELITY